MASHEIRIVHAPWTPEQVQALDLYQHAGVMHPYTCGAEDVLLHPPTGQTADCRAPLKATPSGWVCTRPGCVFTQDWAHEFTADLATVRDMVEQHERLAGTSKHP